MVKDCQRVITLGVLTSSHFGSELSGSTVGFSVRSEKGKAMEEGLQLTQRESNPEWAFVQWNIKFRQKLDPEFNFYVEPQQITFMQNTMQVYPGLIEDVIYYVAQFPKSENSFYAVYDFTEIIREVIEK